MTEDQLIKEASPWPVAKRYGLIGAGLMIGYFLVTNIAGLTGKTEGWVVGLNAIVTTAILFILLHKASVIHRDQDWDGVITFGKSFVLSLFTVLIIAFVYTLFSYLFMKFIDRSILEHARSEALIQLDEQDMDAQSYETSLKWIMMFTGPGFLSLIGFFMHLIWGLAVGVVVGLIIKKDNPDSSTIEVQS